MFLTFRMERTVYSLLRTRDSLMRNCKEYQIPTDWMVDNGILSKVNSFPYQFNKFQLTFLMCSVK